MPDMAVLTDRPLVTLFVMAYNQQDYIRAAVEGAFAQTYQSLEIVLSDDASTDSTFEIMQEMARDYAGPHDVVLNRNSGNLGITAHIDRIMSLCRGEIIVEGCGDDIALPERVERLVEAWRASGGRAKVLHSAATGIDHRGMRNGTHRPPQEIIDRPEPLNIVQEDLWIIGATEAWTRDLYEKFGPLSPVSTLDDRPMAFRGALLGGLVFVDSELLMYREGGVSSRQAHLSGKDYLYGKRLRYLKWFLSTYRGFLRDMERIDFPEREACRAICRERIPSLEFEVGVAEASPMGRVARLPDALRRAYKDRSAAPIVQTFKYVLDRPYMRYLDYKQSLLKRQVKPSALA